MKWLINSLILLFIVNMLLIGAFKLFGALHPNGGILAYTVTTRDLDPYVVLSDVLTGETIELSQHTGEGDITGREPKWTLDGMGISFWVYHNRRDTIAYELALNNYELTNLSEGSDFFSLPIYGANNQQLYSTLPTFLNQPLYLVNEDHPDGLLLANTVLSEPTWSPDGRFVAYINLYEELETDTGPSSGSLVQEIDIYIIELETLTITNYTLDHNTSGVPFWSPDGSTIAFIARDRNIGQIYLLMPATGDIEEVPVNNLDANNDIALRWSPDSRQIAYVSVDSDIMVMDMATYDIQNISNSRFAETDPTWSPDGRFIAFVSSRDGRSDIYIANIATNNIRRLTYTRNEIESDLAWRPR